MYNKIEEIGDNYDEFVEDFYFIEWLRMATDLGASLDEVINTSVLFDELLEELEMAILEVPVSSSVCFRWVCLYPCILW